MGNVGTGRAGVFYFKRKIYQEEIYYSPFFSLGQIDLKRTVISDCGVHWVGDWQRLLSDQAFQ